MSEKETRIDFVSIDLDNIADTLDELEIPKKLDKWYKSNTWIELSDVSVHRHCEFSINDRTLDGGVVSGNIWFYTHEDIKISKKSNLADTDIMSKDVFEKIRDKSIRWVGTNKETNLDVVGVLQIIDWEEKEVRPRVGDYRLDIKCKVRAVQKSYEKHIDGVIADEFIEVDKVEVVGIESAEERNKWEGLAPRIDFEKYTDGRKYGYVFRIHQSGLYDNCANVELHFNWPADFTPDGDTVPPFCNALRYMNGRYVKWHGKDKLGGSASGLLCLKDVGEQSATGIGRIGILVDGTESTIINYREYFETKKYQVHNKTEIKYTDREIKKGDEPLDSKESGLALHTEINRLEMRLEKQLALQQLPFLDIEKATGVQQEMQIVDKVCGTFQIIDRLMDIDSYEDGQRPHSKWQSTEKKLKRFIESRLGGFIAGINEYTETLKGSRKSRYTTTFTSEHLTRSFYKLKHTMSTYIDDHNYEHIFHNYDVEEPYIIVECGGRKQLVLSLSSLQDHVYLMIKRYFVLPLGKCYDDWTDDEKRRSRALNNFMPRYFRPQAIEGVLIPDHFNGGYGSLQWTTISASTSIAIKP